MNCLGPWGKPDITDSFLELGWCLYIVLEVMEAISDGKCSEVCHRLRKQHTEAKCSQEASGTVVPEAPDSAKSPDHKLGKMWLG